MAGGREGGRKGGRGKRKKHYIKILQCCSSQLTSFTRMVLPQIFTASRRLGVMASKGRPWANSKQIKKQISLPGPPS